MPEATPPQRLYEADAVDAYINELRSQIEALQHRLRHDEAAPAGPNADALAQQALTRGAAIVGEARRDAEEILGAARSEADELVSAARRDVEAHDTARRMEAESKASAILEDARRQAVQIIEDAKSEAQSIVGKAEEEVARRIHAATVPDRSESADRRIIEQIEASHRRLLEMFSAIVESVRSPAVQPTPAPFAPAPLADSLSWVEPESTVRPEPFTAEPDLGQGDGEDSANLDALEPEDRRFFDELRASLRSSELTDVRRSAPHYVDPSDLVGQAHNTAEAASPTEGQRPNLSELPPPDPSALVATADDGIDAPSGSGPSRWVRRIRV